MNATYETVTRQLKQVQREINSCNEALYGINRDAAYNADGWDTVTMANFQATQSMIIRELEEYEALRKELHAARKSMTR